MIETIAFDLDDTLFLEKDFVMSGFLAAADYLSKKYHIDKKEAFGILKRDFERGLRGKNFDHLLHSLALKGEKVDNLIQVYRNHRPAIKLCPDAKKSLRNLKSKFKLALITDGHIKTQNNKIKALNIKQYINNIVINDIEKGEKKSDMDSLKNAARKLKIDPKKSVYVGDNPSKDFKNPRRLGMATIRIKRKNAEHSSAPADKAKEADFCIKNLLELDNIIAKLNKK